MTQGKHQIPSSKLPKARVTPSSRSKSGGADTPHSKSALYEMRGETHTPVSRSYGRECQRSSIPLGVQKTAGPTFGASC
jgi:hypothetical protein